MRMFIGNRRHCCRSCGRIEQVLRKQLWRQVLVMVEHGHN